MPATLPVRRRIQQADISPLGVISPPLIVVESKGYSGTLESLFTCVRDRKLDLLEVAMAPICEAYFQYVIAAVNASVDEAAAALTALAYLLERKAWLLLPSVDEEPTEDEPAMLPPSSIGDYQAAMECLQIWHGERARLFFRAGEVGSVEAPLDLDGVTSSVLATVLERLIERASPEAHTALSKPRRSLSDQMNIVLSNLSREWTRLDILAPQPFTRAEAVWWFLAILELMRLGKVRARVTESQVEFALPR